MLSQIVKKVLSLCYDGKENAFFSKEQKSLLLCVCTACVRCTLQTRKIMSIEEKKRRNYTFFSLLSVGRVAFFAHFLSSFLSPMDLRENLRKPAPATTTWVPEKYMGRRKIHAKFLLLLLANNKKGLPINHQRRLLYSEKSEENRLFSSPFYY